MEASHLGNIKVWKDNKGEYEKRGSKREEKKWKSTAKGWGGGERRKIKAMEIITVGLRAGMLVSGYLGPRELLMRIKTAGSHRKRVKGLKTSGDGCCREMDGMDLYTYSVYIQRLWLLELTPSYCTCHGGVKLALFYSPIRLISMPKGAAQQKIFCCCWNVLKSGQLLQTRLFWKFEFSFACKLLNCFRTAFWLTSDLQIPFI